MRCFVQGTMQREISKLKQKQKRNPILLAASLALGTLSLGIGGESPWAVLARHTAALIPSRSSESLRFIPRNWGLANSLKSDIHALDAWKLTTGSRDVVVAVIDTGVDATHPALSPNMWQDSERAGQKVYGWNFVTNQPNPADDHGHGTHVAGIIGAVTQNELGISGVAPKVSIMAVKYYSEKNSVALNLANTVKAINYAIDHGARIINYSGGGPEFSEEEYLAIRRAEEKGVLFVSAAGNEHQDTDKVENYYYPSAYGLSNIISVAAIDMNNELLASSNWGRKKVDVAAPGAGILSTLPASRTGSMTGTSQATAFVSGIAALLLSKDPSLTPQQLKMLITASVDKVPTLISRVASGGKVNAQLALQHLMGRKHLPQNEAPLVASAAARRPVSIRSEDLGGLRALGK